MDNEEWRIIPGFEAYEVSNKGRIRRVGKARKAQYGRVLTPVKYKEGYLYYRLSINNKDYGLFSHRAVALAFIGPRPSPKHEIAHWDGNPQNNSPNNLRWATPQENTNDKKRHGTQPRGETSTLAKLTNEQVRQIRRLRLEGKTYRELGTLFSVNSTTCLRIVKRERKGFIE